MQEVPILIFPQKKRNQLFYLKKTKFRMSRTDKKSDTWYGLQIPTFKLFLHALEWSGYVQI